MGFAALYPSCGGSRGEVAADPWAIGAPGNQGWSSIQRDGGDAGVWAGCRSGRPGLTAWQLRGRIAAEAAPTGGRALDEAPVAAASVDDAAAWGYCGAVPSWLRKKRKNSESGCRTIMSPPGPKAPR